MILGKFTLSVIGFAVGFMLSLFLAPAHGGVKTGATAETRMVKLQNGHLLLENKPCEIGTILAGVNPETRAKLKGGIVYIKDLDVSMKICYLDTGQWIGVMDEIGGQLLIPAEVFNPVKAKPKGLEV